MFIDSMNFECLETTVMNKTAITPAPGVTF